MIRFKLRGVDEINTFLKSLPHGSMAAAIQAMTEYMVGNESHGLRHYPGYKYVSRAAAYGKTFFTDKQRCWFFANLKDGNLKIPYQRTDTLRNGWTIGGDTYRRSIKTRVPYAKWVMGDETQSNHSRLTGWRTRGKVIEDNTKGGMRAATQAVARWIKERLKK